MQDANQKPVNQGTDQPVGGTPSAPNQATPAAPNNPHVPNQTAPRPQGGPQVGPQGGPRMTPPGGRPPQGPRPPHGPRKPNEGGSGLSIFFVIAAVIVFALLIGLLFLFSMGTGEDNPLLQALNLTEVGFIDVILSIVNIVFLISGLVAFISMMITGFLYFVSRRDPSKARKSRKIFVVTSIVFVFLILIYAGLFTALSSMKKGGSIESPGGAAISSIITEPVTATGLAPFEVVLDISAVASPSSLYDWDFGDGTEHGQGPKVNHIYLAPGIFQATVTETMPNGSQNVDSTTITVTGAKPTIEILSDVLEGVAPLVVNFDGGSSVAVNARVVEYHWNFADPESVENLMDGVTTKHEFVKPGEYAVELRVVDSNNNENTGTIMINVLEPEGYPVAKMATIPEELFGQPPLKVEFNASASSDPDGTLTEYVWDFGDGTLPTKGIRSTHIYRKKGAYTAKLTVKDDQLNEDSVSVEILVADEKAKPTPKFKSDPMTLSGEAPLTIQFNATESVDIDGDIVDYEWNFGDKTPNVSGAIVEHSYQRAGTYKITLTTTDNDGLIDDLSRQVRVLVAKKKAPVAVITADPISGTVPMTVKLDGSGSFDEDGEIISYRWDFGDGTSPILAGAQTSHIYEQVGVFNIELTVFDNQNMKGKETISVASTRIRPVAKVSVDVASGPPPLLVEFNAAGSAGNLARYDWDFGDSESGRGAVISHEYKDVGVYEVKLTIYDNAGVTDNTTVNIVVEGDLEE